MKPSIWIYGGVHDDPGSRQQFLEELAKQEAAPHFVAVEWEQSVFDAHSVKPEEYKELPELTGEMLARAKINKGGRPLSLNPRRLISLCLPADVIERWRATGPGWQTRMAERLRKVR
jgi:uncharacterized protein (DUF4415 family)